MTSRAGVLAVASTSMRLPTRLRTSVAVTVWCILLSATACVRIERRTTSVELPPAMLGAWSGGWTSATAGTQGQVSLRVQTFEQHPVVQIESAHPCLQNGAYEFRLRGAHMELMRNGEVVFAGDVDLGARRFSGTYQCTQDQGDWSADWNHDLPEIGNASGTWTGTFAAGSPPVTGDFTMEIEQTWNLGFLQISGEVVVDRFGVAFPIHSGQIEFRDSTFDMLLRGSQLGANVVVQGTGTVLGQAASSGLMLLDDPNVPLVGGTWTAVRQGR